MPKKVYYILLDKDDITKRCGKMSKEEIEKVIKKKKDYSLKSYLNNARLFEGKYILVEDE